MADYLHEDVFEARTASSCEKLRNGAFSNQRSTVHDHYVGASLLDFTEQVRRDHHRAPRCGVVLQHLAHLSDLRRIKPIGGFIEDEDIRHAEHGLSDSEALTHTLAVGANLPVNCRAEPGDLQDVIEIRILLLATACLPIQPQVLPTGQVWQEPWSLDERSDVCERSGSREDRLSEDVRVSSRGVDEPHDHAHRRRLARSVWTQKAEDNTLGDFEGDITNSVDPPLELLGQVLNRDRRVCQVFAGQCPRTSRPQQANSQRYDENAH